MKATVLDPAPFSVTAVGAEPEDVGERGVESTHSSTSSRCATSCDLETLFVEHSDFVFRTCRHLGLERAAAEDATQQVFMTASRKVSEIPDGKERAFLFMTARNIVANARRAVRRRREDFTEIDIVDDGRGPDQLLEEARAREVVERVLRDMDLDLRAAFVLFEVEQLTFTEMAELVGIPRGTVASRVRRAREDFESRVTRLLSSHSRRGPR